MPKKTRGLSRKWLESLEERAALEEVLWSGYAKYVDTWSHWDNGWQLDDMALELQNLATNWEVHRHF